MPSSRGSKSSRASERSLRVGPAPSLHPSIEMHPRFQAFSQAFKSSRLWTRGGGTFPRPRTAQFVCQLCRHKFSTSSIFHKITQGTRRNLATAAKNPKEKSRHNLRSCDRRILTNIEYPRELLIYDAGDTRTTFIAFWKAVALLQCGTCIILITPLLYKNENQPNEYIRTAQAVGGRSNSALYSMSYVPSRYCHVACLPL